MLQEQHDRQIATMTATNKANMDTMIKRINALMAGGVDNTQTTKTRRVPPL
jgi:hypothetical protein